MLHKNKSALICDLAETYGVYDYESLPIKMVATLSAGLGEDSRSKRGDMPPRDTLLLAMIVDELEDIKYGLGIVEGERPQSIVSVITGRKQEIKKEFAGFETVEEFEAERKKILKGS